MSEFYRNIINQLIKRPWSTADIRQLLLDGCNMEKHHVEFGKDELAHQQLMG